MPPTEFAAFSSGSTAGAECERVRPCDTIRLLAAWTVANPVKANVMGLQKIHAAVFDEKP